MTGVRTAVHLGLVYDFPSPVFRTAVRHLTLGVAPSAHTAEGWRERGWPSASLTVIPNGVDTRRFAPGDGRPAARERLGFSGAAGPLIAYVGRLTRVKGILTLARAFAAYRRAGGPGTLVYVGASAGDDEAVLRSFAQAEGLTEPMWAVRPSMARPEDVYRAADLVVVPSEWEEPFGLVPLEAMATGTLAVVSDRGVMPTFVECLDGKAVFRAGNAASLQGRLDYWLSDMARRESAAARVADHVRSTFSFAACGDAYLSALSTASSVPVLTEARLRI
jgi:glycosyltransferase involved in cell wall biosynthesis